jgi:PAS domain S-box-containing protein
MPTISEPVTPHDGHILDLAYDGIFLLALDGTILFWNRGAEEMYGWRREQALGRISHELLRTSFPMPLEEMMEVLLSEGHWTGELVHTTRDGKELIVSARWALERDYAGRPSGILEIVRDITQKRTAEREQARLAALVESSYDAVISKSPDGIIQTWNPGAERLYGYSREEVVGKSINIIVPADRADEELLILGRVRAGERTPAFDTVRIRKDGTPVDVSLTVFPIRDSSQRVIGASHVARDITMRKRFESEIRALNESLERRVEARTHELAEANQELESFSYSVSHDLRAPVRAIDGFSRLVLEESGSKLDEKAKERLQRIRAATLRMGQLIDALLDLSRLSRTELRQERVGLSTLAVHICNELERTAPGRKATFRIEPGLTAYGDPRLIRALIENLIGNAFKFTAGADHAVIEFGETDEGGQRAFYVRDNGVGFDMQYAGQLFAPFQRLHGREEFEGTGIGLATAHRIVTRHGGRIWADAAPGKGATFYFTLEPERKPNGK